MIAATPSRKAQPRRAFEHVPIQQDLIERLVDTSAEKSGDRWSRLPRPPGRRRGRLQQLVLEALHRG